MTIEERFAEIEQCRKADQQYREKLVDEIAKLGYTYNNILRCWTCSKYPFPDIIIGHTYGRDLFYIHVNLTKYNSTTYNIATMYDLFNFIEDMKKKYVNS